MNTRLTEEDHRLDDRLTHMYQNIEELRAEIGLIKSTENFKEAVDDAEHLPDHTRGPGDGRGYRESTFETGNSAQSRNDYIKIKREDISQFNPNFEDPNDLGCVADGKSIIFTDVYSFIERLATFTEDEDTREDAERQITRLLPTLSAGPALLWWTTEMPAASRSDLKTRGGDSGQPTKLFASVGRQIPSQQPSALVQPASDWRRSPKTGQLRWVRAMGTLDFGNDNWHAVMVQIWSNMDMHIKKYLGAPKTRETLADYMGEVEEAKAVLISAAYDRYPSANKYAKSTGQDDSRDDHSNANSRQPSYQSSRRGNSYRP